MLFRKEKETLRVVFAGHVDHGKSSLIGRVLIATGALSRRRRGELEKISSELGEEESLAYLSDQLKEEREKALTIDTTQLFFRTRKREYVLIDAPGHLEFIKNMITGASQADSAALIVDITAGVREQTRRHLYLLSLLGINRVLAVHSKMDLAGYDRELFSARKKEVDETLGALGMFSSGHIPVSAKENVNITGRDKRCPWYGGPAFIEALDTQKKKPGAGDDILRFPVQDVYRTDSGKIIVGRISTGRICRNDRVKVVATGRRMKVMGLRSPGKFTRCCGSGVNIGLVPEPGPRIARGDVLTREDATLRVAGSFNALVFWMGKRPVSSGNEKFMFRSSTQRTECVLERVHSVIDPGTLKEDRTGRILSENHAAIVDFVLDRPLVLERFSDVPEFGRFVVEHEERVIAAGMIPEIY